MKCSVPLYVLILLLCTFFHLKSTTTSAPCTSINTNERILVETKVDPTIKTCVRGGGPWGFFAEFLWVLNHLEYCLAHTLTPVIYWGPDFAYWHPDGYSGSTTNGWEYYFEPVSQEVYHEGDFLHIKEYYKRDNNFSTLWWYVQYLDKKDLLPLEEQSRFIAVENHAQRYASQEFKDQRRLGYPIGSQHLYDPGFRTWVKENLLDVFIKIKEPIQEKIEAFYAQHMAGKKTVGLHLRGKHIGREVIYVENKYLFAEVNKYMDQGYQCFIATDIQPLLEEAQRELHGPVIFYQAERFDATTSPYTGSKKLHPILGENIVIETILLSRCDHFVHTISNVSTAALYFNPNLEHTLIY